VEFNHNSDVQSDMQELRNSLISVRSAERIVEDEYEIVSDHRPVRVRVGTQYPSRLITFNPPNPMGSLQAETPESEISINNAEVRTPDAYEGNPEGLLNDLEVGVETRFLEYQPQYNEYRNAPNTRIEHSLLYNDFDETDLVVQDQRVIEGRRLNLVLFDGEPQRSVGQTATLDPETLDGPTAPITIEDDGDPIELTIPTKAPELWKNEDVIGESFTEGAARARVITSGDQTVTIELQVDETYQLRVARVGFDGGSVDEEQFTPIQIKETGETGGVDSYPGPNITNLEANPNTGLNRGDTFDLIWEASNIGDENDLRGGTPIQRVEWYLESNPDEKYELYSDQSENLSEYVVSNETTIPVDQRFETGENELRIRGQDSRGRWSENDDIGSVTVDVDSTEERETQIAARIDDLSNNNGARFITSISIRNENENFDRIEVDYEPDATYGSADGTINTTRGSVSYGPRGGLENTDFDITIRVIDEENGGETVAATRTISATADTSNPIEENVSLGSSPQLQSEILDRSNLNDGARYRISYETDQTDAYKETQLHLLETDPGNFDEQTENATETAVDLSTYPFDSEYKIAVLTVDSDGVVVDANIEIKQPEETMAGNTEIVSSAAQEPDVPGNSPDSELAFTLEKDGPSDVTIEGIAFEETSSDAITIEATDQGFADGNSFVRTDTDAVLYSDLINLGAGETGITDETFAQWESPEFILTQFRDTDGNQVNIAGETVTVRLYFADGSSRSYELTG